MTIRIPIAVSARHAHLSQATIDEVFGVGHRLRPRTWLSQTGQFAAQETVTSPIVVAIYRWEHAPEHLRERVLLLAVWRKSKWANLALRRRQLGRSRRSPSKRSQTSSNLMAITS